MPGQLQRRSGGGHPGLRAIVSALLVLSPLPAYRGSDRRLFQRPGHAAVPIEGRKVYSLGWKVSFECERGRLQVPKELKPQASGRTARKTPARPGKSGEPLAVRSSGTRWSSAHSVFIVGANGRKRRVSGSHILVDLDGYRLKIDLICALPSMRSRLHVGVDGDGTLIIGPGDAGSGYVGVEPSRGPRQRFA
jgi:hypothetical protein